MDSKLPIAPLNLFKETRANIGNPFGSIIQIHVSQTSTFSIRQRSNRRIIRAIDAYTTQDEFSRHFLSTEACIHRCDASRFPRTFLWRVIHDQKVLEIRSIDLSKSDQESKDTPYTIQLQFSGQLKIGGVALADTDDTNVLNVFALTRSNDLYTFALRKDFFSDLNASEDETARWCKVARPATFSINAPHRLIAASAFRLVVSLSDGRLLQLTRKKTDDGSRWNEAIYGDGNWGSSLRGLVRWQGSNTVRYDGNVLEQGTPLAMTVSPDGKHMFAVCMNHTLRIWNPNKAGAVYSKDLLWQEREPQDIPRVTLDPGNHSFLHMLSIPGGLEGDLYYAVTFSPHDLGQFKFWAVRDPDHGDRGIRDLFPDSLLSPPDPDPSPESKAIWKVIDFVIKGEKNGYGLNIWVLMRSNHQYQLYNLQSELNNLPERWRDHWTATAVYTMIDSNMPNPSTTNPKDPSEEWLNYILTPHKYPDHIIESALAIHCVDRGLSIPNPRVPVRERLHSVIASRASLAEGNTHNDNRLQTTIHREWATLWQDIRDLDSLRYDVVSLALDADMPWISFTDGISAVRACTRLETMAYNSASVLAVSHEHLEMPSVETETGGDPKLPDELAVIIEASATFRKTFSATLHTNFRTALARELWSNVKSEVPLRLEEFYDRCNFAEEVEDGLFNNLTNHAFDQIGGLNNLDTDAFFAIMDSFAHFLPDSSSGLTYSIFGTETLINGAREMILQRQEVLSNLLALCVFTEMEVDRETTPLEFFDGPEIYQGLTGLLKQYQVMEWLVTHIQSNAKREPLVDPIIPSKSSKIDWKPTILETMFAIDLKPQSAESQSQCEALTYTIQDLLQWVIGGNEQVPWDEIPVYIQCHLLIHGNIDLATSFLRFQPSTSWATYIKGRLCLLKGETTEAATYFKSAAPKLCKPTSYSFLNSKSTDPNT